MFFLSYYIYKEIFKKKKNPKKKMEDNSSFSSVSIIQILPFVNLVFSFKLEAFHPSLQK